MRTLPRAPRPNRALPLALPLALAIALAGCAGWKAPPSPPPVRGGALGTLPQGRYECELPGSAGGPAALRHPELDFRIINASSYRVGKEHGTYLLTGENVTMTGGPLRGLALHLVSDGFLRRIEADGSDGEMRCILAARAATDPAPND